MTIIKTRPKSKVVRLPPRRRSAIFVCADRDGAWLTLAGEHGWLFGSRADAIIEAQWLSENFGVPVREIAS